MIGKTILINVQETPGRLWVAGEICDAICYLGPALTDRKYKKVMTCKRFLTVIINTRINIV